MWIIFGATQLLLGFYIEDQASLSSIAPETVIRFLKVGGICAIKLGVMFAGWIMIRDRHDDIEQHPIAQIIGWIIFSITVYQFPFLFSWASLNRYFT